MPPIEKGNDVEIYVACNDLGTVNADFSYTPPPKHVGYYMIVCDHHMTFAPTRSVIVYADGQKTTKVEKSGPPAWQIADQQTIPFTTVNTAIRYVLEIERSTKDPVIRKNAGETLTKLLRLH